MSVSEAAREGRLRTTGTAMLDCMRRWATLYPHELDAIDKQVRFHRETQARTDGFGPDRNIRQKGQVPVTLHRMMQREIHPDWLETEELVNLFFQIFRVGAIRKGDLRDRWKGTLR